MRRFLPIFVLTLVVAGAVASAAPALSIDDDPCPTVSGENTNTCPPGTTGIPYSIKFKERQGSGCWEGGQTFAVVSGALPPGLSLASSGWLTGTPTEAGTFKFYLEMSEPPPSEDPPCRGDKTQKEFTLVINPGVPKLTIGPESAAPGTAGVQYLLAMTATVADSKTWSIVDGALPPGLAIDPSSGVISGVPTATGAYSFTVLAVIDAQRSDTKALTIEVRAPVAIVAAEPLAASGAATRWEVGVPLSATLTATGGTGQYTWTLAAGSLPPGLGLAADGSIVGRPLSPGTYRFTAAVVDTESRRSTYAGRLVVAPALSVVGGPLRIGKVGRTYRAKLVATGGVGPRTWRVVGGALPRGLRLDPDLGVLYGIPRVAGRYRVVLRATDGLNVTARRSAVLRVLR